MRLPRSLDALPVEGRRVLVRADLNVPLAGGTISDDTRIRAAVPTIQALRARGARVIVCSHLGRPKGEVRPELSLRPVAERLAELLGAPVAFAPDCVGQVAQDAVEALAGGDVLLLENLRFHVGEEADDSIFAAALAGLAEVYVDDAFGAAHRAHASVTGVAALLPAAAGYLLRRELEVLGQLLDAPAHPFVVVSGGVKVADKIGVIERLAGPADAILIGGAMAYTFAVAMGGYVGSSLHEGAEGQEQARRAIAACDAAGCQLLLPPDSVCGRSFSADPPQELFPSDAIDEGWMGLDIGAGAAASYAEHVRTAATVFWNGPMGAFELAPYAAGTLAIAEAIADCPGTTVVGGGDSVAAITQAGLADRVTHISTGGGASLELLEGRTLPGVAALPTE
ncbi:MAG TPA: phosphoglycerate kinase [Gaiellales bacterium]